MSSNDQINLFEMKEWWEDEWQDMPEFVQENLKPFRTVYLHFKNREDMEAFEKLTDQKITPKTKFVWYPKVAKYNRFSKRYVDTEEETTMDENGIK
jgi:hypothetical protein